MIKQNLHTHTVFCDGKNTCEELIKAAIERGFTSLGFSGHGFTPFHDDYCMSIEATKEYSDEINRLREKYNGKIQILKGTEKDLYSVCNNDEYDYIIGSVHYVYKNGQYLEVDASAEKTKKIIKEHFGGDYLAYSKAYYEEVTKVPETTKCDILGHFDLVTKFSKQLEYDFTDHKYMAYATDAVDAVSDKLKIFEVNTGAMSRGYTDAPYPTKAILKHMLSCNMCPVISSDCHSKEHLDYAFDDAAAILKSVGFKEVYYLASNGFEGYKI